ncbi:MAG: hypothetical protein ABI835_04235 [Chloroflexota bacterium]
MTPQNIFARWRWRLTPEWGVAGILLLIAAALWLPFGFNVGFWGDDWFFYLNARFGSAWGTLSRPLLPLAFIFGYGIAPGQFAGFNLTLALLLFARSGLCYALLRRLRTGRAPAFAAAVLALVYPADTGVFYLGAIAVYLAWVAFLLALYLLILYWQSPRLIYLALMWVAQIVSLGTYEATYPLIFVSPLVLLLLEPRLRRRWTRILFRWYIFPALNLIRQVSLFLLNPGALTYQTGLVASSNSPSAILASFLKIYQRHFFTGWVEGDSSPAYALVAVMTGVLAGVACWRLARGEQPRSKRFHGVLILVGLAIIGLAVLVLLPTSLRDVTLRTYFASSLGAALALAAAAWLLTRRALLFALLIGLLVSLGFLRLLQQHDHLAALSAVQQADVIQVAQLAPSLSAGTALLIMDETPGRELSPVFFSRWNFQNPFLLAYDDPSLLAALCYPDDAPQNPEAYCAFQAEYVEVRISPQIVWQRPYDRVVLIRYTTAHQWVLANAPAPYATSALYDPGALIDEDAALPEVIRTMFQGVPASGE